MRPFLGRAKCEIAICLTLFFLSAAPVAAQTAAAQTAVDPAALDVAGVKLGMTPDEAIANLKKFDGAFTITKHYLDSPMSSTFGSVGKELATFAAVGGAPARPAYFNDLSAVNEGNVTTTCDSLNCPKKHYHDDVEAIKVWFSPIPGHERVIAIQRAKTFYKAPPPTIASLKDGLFSKYPKDQVTYEDNRAASFGPQYSVDWLFDSKGRIISKAAGKGKGASQAWGALPGNVKPGDGIGLSAMLQANHPNTEIVMSGNGSVGLEITLYDGDALFKSGAQSKATYEALKAQAIAKEVGQGAKSQSQTKF